MRKKISLLIILLGFLSVGASITTHAQEQKYESYGQAGFYGKYEQPSTGGEQNKLPGNETSQLPGGKIPNAGDTSNSWMFFLSIAALMSSVTLLHWKQKETRTQQQTV
ncbi:MAG: LPXTG cell wall anchor domain-containing protein [Streptococcaceae bacterium]|nr:LPXTG cell wall anchor domain-containing protein [Streptococcaceae bacterium]